MEDKCDKYEVPVSFEMQFYWNKIEKKVFNFLTFRERVDLDAVAIILNKNTELLDVVYYRKPISDTGAIHHLGDDTDGNIPPNQDSNEILKINADLLPVQAHRVVFVLNSYKKQSFSQISKVGISIYDTNLHQSVWSKDYPPSVEDNILSSAVVELILDEEKKWFLRPIKEYYNEHRIDQVIKAIQQNVNNNG